MPGIKKNKKYDWTVMLYCYPLDKVFDQPFETLLYNLGKKSKSKNVKILGQIYSKRNVYALGIRDTASRIEVNSHGDVILVDHFQGRGIDISSTESLADFMSWCRRKAPAKNYLLAIWDHGGCFYLFDSYETKMMSMPSKFKMENVYKTALIKKLYKSSPGRKKKYGYWFLAESSKNLSTSLKINRCINLTRRFEVPDENYSDKPKLIITNNRVGKYRLALIVPEKLTPHFIETTIREPLDALRFSLHNENSTGSLMVKEIKEAITISFPGKKVGNILFIACCMQILETAYELKDVCDFITASEDLMDFKVLENINSFEKLVKKPLQKPKDLAMQLVKDFPGYISGLVEQLGTLSSVQTSKIKDLAIQIDGLADYLISNRAKLKSTVKAARNKCRYFSWLTKFCNIDFIWFLKNLHFATSDKKLKMLITEIINHTMHDPFLKQPTADKLVVSSFAGDARKGDLTKESYGAHGFTIFFPKNINEFRNSGLFDFYTPGSPDILSFVTEHKWADFLTAYDFIGPL